ncbi:hypothetical protein [Larkinella soli]|uniref:hypothetical protein n=1 Tax=Larkinella soli TaxID=1770527 RepID=UPI000FFB3414|nr:hypothetical protein [Larkinella soli]
MEPPVLADTASLSAILHRIQLDSRPLWLLGLGHLVLFVVLGVAALLDSRQLMGVSLWIKPMKFAISIAIYTLTLAWLLTYSDLGPRGRFWVQAIVILVMVPEISIIIAQAARGQTSHFNISTPLNGLLFNIMGILIMINTFVVAFVMIRFFLQPAIPGMPPAFLWSIRLGLLIFVLASLQGFLMVGRMAHTVGAPDGGPGLPFVNWSSTAGDLRIAHFVGMHAIQVLPIATLLLLRNNPRLPGAVVVGMAAAYAFITVLILMGALRGRPLL